MPVVALICIIVYVDQVDREPALHAAGWKDRANQVPAAIRSWWRWWSTTAS